MSFTLITPPVPQAPLLEKAFFRRLGYKNPDAIPQQVRKHGQQGLQDVLRTARPTAMYAITPVAGVGAQSIQGEGITISSLLWSELAGKMPSPRLLAVFALTLGRELEESTAQAMQDSTAMGYFMHEAGALLAEMAADAMQEMIAQDPALDGLAMTRRFSPGYCDWPTTGQKEIFGFLDPGQIGVTATSAWAMTPSKSITGVILFARSRPHASPCGFCANKTCRHRRG